MSMAYQRQSKESHKDPFAFSEPETVALKENIALEGPVFPLVPMGFPLSPRVSLGRCQ